MCICHAFTETSVDRSFPCFLISPLSEIQQDNIVEIGIKQPGLHFKKSAWDDFKKQEAALKGR